jgi:hypothetical protein
MRFHLQDFLASLLLGTTVALIIIMVITVLERISW